MTIEATKGRSPLNIEVVTFGESMGSLRSPGLLRLGGPLSMTMGGAESNVAIGLSRLGHSVRWVGRLGADEVGAYLLRMLRAEGVLVDAVHVDPTRPTGLMLVERRTADLSRVAYYRAGSAAAALSVPDLNGTFAAGTRILHFSGITPALSPSAATATRWAAETARELGVLVSFDVNFRAALWRRDEATAELTALARLAGVVFASEDELSLIAGGADEESAVAELLDLGVETVVLKRGAGGATGWNRAGQTSVPARTVTAVDSIGAGDAFTAGFLSALLDGEEMLGRLERGAVLGAFAVSAPGDWDALPNRSELELLDRPHGSTIR